MVTLRYAYMKSSKPEVNSGEIVTEVTKIITMEDRIKQFIQAGIRLKEYSDGYYNDVDGKDEKSIDDMLDNFVEVKDPTDLNNIVVESNVKEVISEENNGNIENDDKNGTVDNKSNIPEE